MQFRVDSKQHNCSELKINELAMLSERAIRRINFNYTQHLICDSNTKQRKLDKVSNTQCKPQDQLATSTTGFIAHLNCKLGDMVNKGDAR